MCFKESDTGETYIGNVDGSQSDDRNGTWVIERYTRARSDFPGQLEHYMNGRSIGHNVRDKGSESADERIARYWEQINALEERFGHFMQTHGEFAEIERTYNLTFNNYVAPERDSSDLGLTGISGQVKPHPFQNQGVRYLSEEGGGILGDDVGLGKTTQAISFSLYDRQMGRSRKHCIVVPKAVLANWYMEGRYFLKQFIKFIMVKDHIEVWNNCLHHIKKSIDSQPFKTWFEPIKPVLLNNDVITIQVPNKLFYEWLEEHYVDVLKKAVKSELGYNGRLEYHIMVDNHRKIESNKPVDAVDFPKQMTDQTKFMNPFVIPGIRKVKIDAQLNDIINLLPL